MKALNSIRLPNISTLAAITVVALLATALACGTDSSGGDSGSDGAGAASEVQGSGEGVVDVFATEGTYTPESFVNPQFFKQSKSYDVEGLEGATEAIYGFFGEDKYDRQDVEIRFYPDHATALSLGVDFANEATGPDAVIAEDVQRWDEGLVQRRACQGNTRGSHHSGKCDNANYGDYAIMGNAVVLCEGKDAETALALCREVYNVFAGS